MNNTVADEHRSTEVNIPTAPTENGGRSAEVNIPAAPTENGGRNTEENTSNVETPAQPPERHLNQVRD